MDLTPNTYKGAKAQPLFDDIKALRDDLLAEKTVIQAPVIIPGELSEAFALIDPDLAYLHKDMKTANAQLEIARKSGQMIDMAQWRFESAETAYKTRLMEVRKIKSMRKHAKTALSGDEIKAKREMRNSSMQEEMNKAFELRRKKMMEEKRRKDEKQGGWFFYLMLGMWLAQMNAKQRTNNLQLSHLQAQFFNARTGTA